MISCLNLSDACLSPGIRSVLFATTIIGTSVSPRDIAICSLETNVIHSTFPHKVSMEIQDVFCHKRQLKSCKKLNESVLVTS